MRVIKRLAFILVVLLSGTFVYCQQNALPSAADHARPYTPPKPTIAVATSPPVPRPAGRTDRSDLDRFRGSRQRDQLLASTIDSDHEDAGVETANSDPSTNSPYTGVFAVHAVYPTGKIQLRLPDNPARTQILYAATTRPPNGACIEVGAAYTTDVNTKTTTAGLYVFDFCKPGGGDFAIPPMPVDGKQPIQIDQNFMETYAGAMTQSIPAYTVAIFTPDSTISDRSKWYAQLYNYKAQQWDTIYSTQGFFWYDTRGWSIFETYFQAGLCSESLPPLGADELSFFNSNTRTWERVGAQMSDMTAHISYGGSHNHNCFVADATGPASYSIKPNPPVFHWWQVTSK